LETLAPEPRFALKLNLEPFSPRKLMAALGREFPLHTADPAALGRVSLKADLTGTARAVSVSDGVLALDDTTARFSLQGKEFDKPHLVFDFALDTIDADRYLPAKNTAEAAGAGSPGAAPDAAAPRSDNNHLRRPVLDGLLRIGTLKMHGARIQDLSVKVGAEGGRYRFDPLSLNLYGGSMGGSAVLDVRGKEPRTGLDLKMERIQAGPLLVDVMRKDVLEGSLNADVALSLAGDAPDRIKASLNGKGRLQFNDGAIKGIDLAGMARNVQAAFGLAERPAQRPRTDFSELKVPFTLSNGLFQTPETVLASPFLRLTAAGTADLVREQLDFRVEPKLVATIKGQGDTAERAGLTVPILVSGTFSNPIFRPDLEGMARQRLQEALTDPSKLKETLQGDRQSIETLKEQGRQLLKGFGLGN
jgi:AsmA protein